jgi:hypothetical protein
MHMYVKRVKTAAAMFGSGGVHRARVAQMIGLVGDMSGVTGDVPDVMPVAVYRAPGRWRWSSARCPDRGRARCWWRWATAASAARTSTSCSRAGASRASWPGHEFTGTIAAVGDGVGRAGRWASRGGRLVAPVRDACRRCREGKPSQCENGARAGRRPIRRRRLRPLRPGEGPSLLRLPEGCRPATRRWPSPWPWPCTASPVRASPTGTRPWSSGPGPSGPSPSPPWWPGASPSPWSSRAARRQLAADLGATEVLAPDDLETYPPWEPERISPRAVDVVLECSGKKAAMETGFHQLRRGGTAGLVGAGIEAPSFDPNRFILNELEVTGRSSTTPAVSSARSSCWPRGRPRFRPAHRRPTTSVSTASPGR